MQTYATTYKVYRRKYEKEFIMAKNKGVFCYGEYKDRYFSN